MAVPSVALTGPFADLRLAQLGLHADELREAVLIGYNHADGCTDHDPRSLPGTLVWGKGVGHLRDVLKPRDWRADRTSNLESVVHPTNSHAIVLSTGTADTGREKGKPRTKRPKGPATHRVVERNRQLSLTGENSAAFAGTGADEVLDTDAERETYFLLHFYDRSEGRVRIELSLPSEMKGKQIADWRERIILADLPFAGDVEIPIDDEDDGIDIDVSRRAD